MFERCCEIARSADIMVVVGTSLGVYPAASLVMYINKDVPIYLVDPGTPATGLIRNKIHHIREKAATGLPKLVETLRQLAE